MNLARPNLLLAAAAVAIAITATAGCGAGESDDGDDDVIVLRGRVIDGGGAAPIERGAVVVEGERIRCVGAVGDCPAPDGGARTVDVENGTILPGLIDLHVHARPDYIPMFLAAGVTAVRDANNALDTVRAMEAVGPDRPRMTAAGPMLIGADGSLAGIPSAAAPDDGPISATMPLVIDGAESGRAAVDSLASADVDVVKLYEHLPPDAFDAIIERASGHGLPTMGDIGLQLTGGLRGTHVDALQAMDAGLGTLEHMSGFALAYRRLGGDPSAETLDPDRIDRLARAVVESGTMLVPTVISAVQFATRSPSLDGVPLADRLAPIFSPEWSQRHPLPPPALALAEADLRLSRAILTRVIELGAADRIAAGTDSPNPYVLPGGSLHQELELLVDIGLSPLEAIRAATVNAAAILGRDDIGRLAEGRRADILVVEGDPTADIRATRNVHTVLLDGRVIDIDALVDTVEAEFGAAMEEAVAHAQPAP